MRFSRRVAVIIRAVDQRGFLRQAGQRGTDARIRYFGTFVEIYGGKVPSENTVGALIGIQPAQPDLGTVGQNKKIVAFYVICFQAGECGTYDLGQRIKADSITSAIAVKTQYGMTAAGASY